MMTDDTATVVVAVVVSTVGYGNTYKTTTTVVVLQIRRRLYRSWLRLCGHVHDFTAMVVASATDEFRITSR